MRWTRRSYFRLGSLFRKERLDRELDEEVASHLAMNVEDNLRAGMTPVEARRDALMKLGGIEQTKEIYREHRGVAWLETVAQDVRFGLRMLRKNPGFTVVAVLTLALGIGANTAIFSVINGVLLRSLPYQRPSELVEIYARNAAFDFSDLGMSVPDVSDIRAGTTAFVSSAMYQDAPKDLTGAGRPERIEGAKVSEEYFSVLGIHAVVGRVFDAADMRPGTNTVILSHALWRDRFGSDVGAIGKSITLDGESYTIVGVLPASGLASDPKIWMALIPSQEEMASREGFDISVVARLKSEVTIEKAQTELDTIAARISSENPDTRKGWSVHAISLRQSLLGDARVPLLILFAAVGFVLLIACANVSNLFLARGWARRREFAIRSAVGATRGALLRQLAVECILVALMGGASALVIASWTLHGLRGLLPPEIPRLQEIRIDGMVAWFTFGASMLAAVCSGLAPAMLSTRGDVSATIKESGAGAGGNNTRVAHNFLRQLLVVGEVALAVVLLIGATLAVRSFGRLMEVDRGFKPDHLVTLKIEFPKFRFEKPEQAIAFVRQVLDGTSGVPGVETASASLVYPLSDEVAETTFQTEATVNDAKLGEQTALANRVAPQFFHAFRIPLLAGRDFNGADLAGGAPVYIVNETLAQKYFGSVNVAGRRLSTRKESGHWIWGEIIGVAGNVTGLDPAAESKPQVYAPFFQMREASGAYLVVRCKADPAGVVPAIEERIWAVNKNEPIDTIQTLTARIAEISATPRSQSFLLGIFGGLGLVLALLGVYGVMSYVVSLQTREIGIRMALGAGRLNILRAVIAQGLKLTAAGILIGVGGGLALTRFIRSLLYGISATDPLTFVSVPLVLLFIATIACYIPARRATKIAPTIALRYE